MSRYVNIDDVTAKQYENSEVELGVLAYDYDEIDAMPFLDIVTCKECKWSKVYRNKHKKFYRWCRANIRSVEDDSFCSYGEREENE